MKRISIMVFLLLVMAAFSGTVPSSSMAGHWCVQVDEQFEGRWPTDECAPRSEPGDYIRISGYIEEHRNGQWCAETEFPRDGNRETETCEGRLVSEGNFILVKRAPPNWHVNGTKLSQGSRSIKLQSKGSLSLKGTIGGLAVTITCGQSTSNGTIDGQGETKQGQGKGSFKYEQCNTTATEGGGACRKPTSITTNQLKAHLAISGLAEQMVELFEASPAQQMANPAIATIGFNECTGTLAVLAGISAPLRRSVAGFVIPQDQEDQEGSLYFPSSPFVRVKHEGQEPTVGLTLNGAEAVFIGYYDARLQKGTFGAFFN